MKHNHGEKPKPPECRYADCPVCNEVRLVYSVDLPRGLFKCVFCGQVYTPDVFVSHEDYLTKTANVVSC